MHFVKHIKYELVLCGVWNNKSSQNFLKVSKTHALPFDGSIYATSEYVLQFLHAYHSEMPTSP